MNWSWGSTVNFSVTTPVFAGTRSTSFSASGWGALYLHRSSAFDTTPYRVVRFAARGTQAGQEYIVRLYDAATNALIERPLSSYGGAPPTGSFRVYTIPLVDLAPPGAQISGISIQNVTGASAPPLYIDELVFSAS
jgi:hypothetical protein